MIKKWTSDKCLLTEERSNKFWFVHTTAMGELVRTEHYPSPRAAAVRHRPHLTGRPAPEAGSHLWRDKQKPKRKFLKSNMTI